MQAGYIVRTGTLMIMMKRTLALITMISMPLLLVACGGKPATPTATPTLQVAVTQADQYKQLGSKIPDGQYVVLKLNLQNSATEGLNVTPGDFQIEKVSANASDKYTQKNETGLSSPFTTLYGMENRDKLLESSVSMVYPKRDVQRYIIYMLPSDADLSSFRLIYSPMGVSVPLVSTTTVVSDHRIPPKPVAPPPEETGEDTAGDSTGNRDANTDNNANNSKQ